MKKKLQKKLLESSESFLDGSLKVLGVEIADEEKGSSLVIKETKIKFEEIKEYRGGNFKQKLAPGLISIEIFMILLINFVYSYFMILTVYLMKTTMENKMLLI
jgi:hypothetical protein